MESKQRLYQLEAKLDRMNPDSKEYETLSAEADQLAEEISNAEQAIKDRILARELEKQKKIDNIIALNNEGKTDELVRIYGDEFINDYHVEGNTITSSVARDDQNSQWTLSDEEETNAKLRQLLYYRIYDHYIRAA